MKKELKLKGISILMAILMVATIIPMGAISSFAITSGDYEYLVFSETDKTIGITKYIGTDVDVTIPSTIDEYKVLIIYDQAFYNCTGLKSVIIPNSVTKISDWAFESCTGLKEITIPESVTNIGYYVFSGCTGLTAINVSEDNTAYSSVDGVLYNKDKTSILICPIGKSGEAIIPDGVISIGEVAFEGCAGLTGVTIPNSVTTIGEFSFASCTGLTGITLPNSLTTIKGSAFRSCTGLKGIIIPDSVTSIGGSAFYACTALKSVTVGDSTANVGNNAFFNTPFYDSLPDGEVYLGKVFYAYKGAMPKDAEITIKAGTISITDIAFMDCKEIKYVTIPDSVTTMGYGIFMNCTGLKGITIGSGLTSINGRDFGGCTALTAINISENNTAYSSIDGVLYNKDKTSLLTYPNGKSGELTIPNSVTSIGERAFSDCTGLTSVIIPSSVRDIGKYAFFACSSLKDITIPDSIMKIGDCAFLHTPFYNSQPDGEIYLGKVFYTYKGAMPKDAEIIIKAGTISIADSAFFGFKDLKSVTIPDSVKSMGDWAFFNCSGLTSISIGNGLTNIGASAFSDCISLKDIKFPDSLTAISWGAFSGCTGLTGVTIGDSVTSISGNAFSDTPFFASLPDGEVYLGKVLYAYKGIMPQNTEITIKSGTISITDNALIDCTGLKSVIIPNSVTDIGYYAFRNCTDLKSLIIPNSITSIGEMAFENCGNNFTIIAHKGSAAEKYAKDNKINFQLLLLLGDVTGDGRVTSGDAIAVLRAEAQLRTLTAEEFTAADVVKDNRVTSGDAIRILRYEAQLVDKL